MEKSKLKKIRDERGLTIKELSELSCVPFYSVEAYNKGAKTGKDINKASIDKVLKLASALECPLSALLEGDEMENLAKKVSFFEKNKKKT